MPGHISLTRPKLPFLTDNFESRHDKAVWTYIHATDVWNLAVRFARADSLSRSSVCRGTNVQRL